MIHQGRNLARRGGNPFLPSRLMTEQRPPAAKRDRNEDVCPQHGIAVPGKRRADPFAGKEFSGSVIFVGIEGRIRKRLGMQVPSGGVHGQSLVAVPVEDIGSRCCISIVSLAAKKWRSLKNGERGS